jgi:hypothetical protein
MEKVSIIGLDLAKRRFQMHGARATGEHARSWGVSRRELRNVIVMAHPESWVAPLE